MADTLNERVTGRLVDHFRNATTDMSDSVLPVPIRSFTSKERLADELALMRSRPIVVAHRSELPGEGCFITCDVLGTPVIIVRTTGGGVAAYHNMCRHRGGKVEKEASGERRVFSCQYHGWSYNRDDGSLRHVPYEETYGQLDHACLGLAPIKAELRHGMIWLDFSNHPTRTVRDWLGPELEGQIEPFALEETVIVLDKTFNLDVNWKLVMDGANDILHLKFLHPTGVARYLVTGVSVFQPMGPHGQQFSPRKKMETAVREGEDLAQMWRYIGSNLRLYPNSFFTVAPDHVEFWTVWPSITDPGKSTTHIRFLMRESILDDVMVARAEKSWEILEQAALEEDFPMEVSIQRNAWANEDEFFYYGRNEVSIQHLHRMLARDISEMRAARPASN